MGLRRSGTRPRILCHAGWPRLLASFGGRRPWRLLVRAWRPQTECRRVARPTCWRGAAGTRCITLCLHAAQGPFTSLCSLPHITVGSVSPARTHTVRLLVAMRPGHFWPGYPAVIKNGRASTHWGTQIDTRFKELVQNDPLLRGEVAVSPRSLPKGSGAPDVIDLRSKRWWDVTSTAEEFAKKPAKYGTQFGDGTSLLYGEP